MRTIYAVLLIGCEREPRPSPKPPAPITLACDFDGNAHISSAELCAELRRNDDALTSWPEETLYWFYSTRGYESARFRLTQLTADPPSTVTVHYMVTEGPRFKIASVSVLDGSVLLPVDSPMREFTRVRAGDWYNHTTMREDYSYLTGNYGDAGYYKVDVRPELQRDWDAGLLAITFKIVRGPIGTVDVVRISGNSKVSEATIRSLLSVHVADRYNETNLNVTKKTLEHSKLFSQVAIAMKEVPGQVGHVAISIEVREP